MILLCNGDSWTGGCTPAQNYNLDNTKTLDWYDIIPNFGYAHKITNPRSKNNYKYYESSLWPKVLGENLKVETWNAGRSGTGNLSIASRTIVSVEYLKKLGKKDITVVVGWSSKYRVHILEYNNNSKDYGPHNIRPQNGGKVYKELLGEINENIFVNDWIENILLLQNYLKLNNIKYLFFNAFDYPVITKDNPLGHLVDDKNWVNGTIEEDHFKSFILKEFNSTWESSDEYYELDHPTGISHKAWGKYLTDYMLKNIL